jgi:hypothetical protein
VTCGGSKTAGNDGGNLGTDAVGLGGDEGEAEWWAGSGSGLGRGWSRHRSRGRGRSRSRSRSRSGGCSSGGGVAGEGNGLVDGATSNNLNIPH